MEGVSNQLGTVDKLDDNGNDSIKQQRNVVPNTTNSDAEEICTTIETEAIEGETNYSGVEVNNTTQT